MNFKTMSAVLLSGFCMVGASALMAADNTAKAPVTTATPAQANVGQAIDNSSMPANPVVNSSMPTSTSMPGNSDDVTPDTATGDDDY